LETAQLKLVRPLPVVTNEYRYEENIVENYVTIRKAVTQNVVRIQKETNYEIWHSLMNPLSKETEITLERNLKTNFWTKYDGPGL
jgi:hypothetical protein